MHEYGVALDIAEIAMKSAAGRTMTKINLRIGDVSGVFIESLTMYLELIFKEKQEQAVTVAIERVKASFQCSCGNRYSPEKLFDACPSCGGFERTVLAGQECTIESIEVEDE